MDKGMDLGRSMDGMDDFQYGWRMDMKAWMGMDKVAIVLIKVV